MSMMRTYMKHDATLVQVAVDAWKENAAETSTAFKCQRNPGTRLVRDERGQQVVSTEMLRCLPDLSIVAGDYVTLDGVRTSVIAVKPQYAWAKVDHKEVYLQ
jgi:hypothetical protein